MKSSAVVSVEAHFSSKNVMNLGSTDVNVLFDKSADKMLENMASYQSRGSNWRFKAVSNLDINTIPYKPLKGKSYIPLPAFLANKKAIINMENKDDRCFNWSITRALNPVERDSKRITKIFKVQYEKLNWSGIQFPVAANANVISKFEKNNNVKINLFGYENDVGIYPLYI